MHNYLRALDHVLTTGVRRENRTGTDAISTFGICLDYDLRNGFPIITTKKIFYKSIVAELVGFIRGYDNVQDFNELGTKIWDANAASPAWQNNVNCSGEYDLGRIYGVQWRRWRSPYGQVSIDQLSDLVKGLKEKPFDRRHIVTAWNPAELDMSALPPCHLLFQCWVGGDNDLHMIMYQRSCDMFLGVPFNITSYALLLSLIANVIGYTPATLKLVLADAHIYVNHIEQVKEQLTRTPQALPKLWFTKDIKSLDDVNPDDIKLINYTHYDSLPADMAV